MYIVAQVVVLCVRGVTNAVADLRILNFLLPPSRRKLKCSQDLLCHSATDQ
jgi:hypothetical protein